MIYLLLADGFEEIEALCPLDLLRRAGKEVRTVSVGELTVTGAHGIRVHADITEKEATLPCELLILPGGMPGSLNLDKAPCTDRLIQNVLQNKGHLSAICAAPLVLGRRGLLAGKRAVCYPGFEKELEGAEIAAVPCITDGNVTTAVGMGAAFDFGLELVKLTVSAEKAAELSRAICLSSR